ncbi:MAG: 2-oxoacid:ferredoxin oxidoreductase subunit beta [Gammaproteobacteria bacterium]|nr:2-oxoacid:ferredoxin oxidoreductase subunit beta [Gammaproteobacteria bacterium]
MNAPVSIPSLTPKDYATDQEVRWCPGCGDYAILKTIQKLMPELGVPKERSVFVSGIGCSSRFPYYMNTYGFHTIHGRAPAVATGVKLANPDLDVWLITGDGDGLSIGGNHLLHILRRNVDVNVLMFNNEIYGLTKGQYSPTSKLGKRTPSTPEGSVDSPIAPCQFALGAGARFVARSIDTAKTELADVVTRGHQHHGTSFVEIFQNCNVYNDQVFAHFTDRKTASDTQLHVEHGKPLLFGAERNKGLRLDPKTLTLEVVQLGVDGCTEADILVHDETNRTLAQLLVGLESPAFPVALGVLYCDPQAEFVDTVYAQRASISDKREPADINALLRRGHTWQV